MVDIRMPDGRIVRFPDSLTDKQIRGLIVSKYPRETNGMMTALSGPQGSGPHAMPANRAGTGPAAASSADSSGGMSLADFGGRLRAFGTALDDAMPPSARNRGNFSGNRRENGNALANVLGNPTVAEMLLKNRLSLLG